MIFIIDPGHGKDTPGKRANGLMEYEFNYDVANRLKDLLAHYGKVVLTMEVPQHPYSEMSSEGRKANLQYRCDVANRVKADAIFISIHANAHSNTDVSGYEIYHYPTSQKGKILATHIHNAAKEVLGVGTEIKDRGIKTAKFYVLRYTKMPAVLIEHEFYTNLEGVKRLKDDKFRQNCAEHILKGILSYLGIEEKNLTKLVGKTQATLQQMQEWAKNRGATQKFINVAELYLKYAKLTGIRGDVLYCQSAKETNFGKYTGAVKEEMNNFAGIKIKNPTGDKTYDHESFATMDDGVRAHFNHMCAYVGLNPVGQPHDRYYLVKSLSWAGSIKYVEELGGKWAPNPDYGMSIIRDYLTDLLNTKVETVDYKKLYHSAIEENKALRTKVEELRDKLEKIKKIVEV